MKILTTASFLIFSLSSFAKEYFSNGIYLADQQKLLLVHKKSEVGEENIIELQLYDAQKNKKLLDLLPLQKNQDVVKIFRNSKNKDELYFILQIQNAGYSKPDFYSYNLSTSKWRLIRGEINCTHLEKMEAQGDTLKLQCGEDYVTPPKQKNLKIKVAGIREPLAEEVPLWENNKPQVPGEIVAESVKFKSPQSEWTLEALSK